MPLGLRRHRPAVTLVAFTVAALAWTNVAADGLIPVGIYGLGAVGGAVVALHAAGLVVVFRANRVINFAQVQMSVLGGLLFASLVQRRLFLVGLHKVCRPCLDAPTTVGDLAGHGPRANDVLEATGLAGAGPATPLAESAAVIGETVDPSVLAASVAPGWLVQLNYWLSVAVSVAVVVLLVWAVHALFVKRFNDAPRLILTVATLGAGEFALTAGRMLLGPFLNPGVGEPPVAGPSPPPLDVRFDLSPAVFRAPELMAVALAVLALGGLAWFLRKSSLGVVLRGASENPTRARTLGVDIDAVTSRAWMLAGLLGGLAAVLATARVGTSALEGFGTMVEALVAAVAGGLTALPLTIAAAVVIAVVRQAALWATDTAGLVDVVLLGLVGVLLAARHSRAGRAEIQSQASWEASREIRPTPAELRRHPAVRNGAVTVGVVLALVALGYPWFMSPAQVSLAQSTMVMAMVGLSLLVLTGWAGQISLGQIGFAAVGAWVAAATGATFAVALPLGAVMGAVVATAVGVPALRLRGLYLAIASLAFGAAASAVLLDADLLGRHLGSVNRPILLGIDFHDDRSFYYLVLVMLGAAVVAVAGMRRSRTARALIAARDNEMAAEAFGVNLLRARLGAFAVSGFVAAAAGVLLAYAQTGVQAQTFAPGQGVAVFLVTIIGGVGAISGPILGALFFGGLSLLGNTAFSTLVDLLRSGGLLVVAVLLFMPGGLAQAVFGMRDAWLRRIAARERIVVPSLVADTGRLTGRRIPIAPRDGDGGTGYVPVRYRLDGQWATDMVRRERAPEQRAETARA